MSWYKRTPRVKTPEKVRPYKTSPIADQIMKETKKKTGPSNKEEKKNE